MQKSQTIYDVQNECMPVEQLRQVQLVRLQETVARCYNNVPFYRRQLDAVGLKPEDIRTLEDIEKLPFTNKTDLRDEYPFGLFAAKKEDIVRVHASSGTTGKPTTVGYTRKDIDSWAQLIARCIGCAGGTSADIVQVAYGYGLFTGGLGLHYGAERIGAMAVPTSTGNTARQIMLMQDYGTTIFACTPSYALLVAETIRDMGIQNSLQLKYGIFGGEPWTEKIRQSIEELMGIKALDIYGLSETMGPGVAMECLEGRDGLHFWEDYFYFEIIDPDTGKQLPDGEFGELVITTLAKEGMPTLRYRTHDITCILKDDCPCGRTHRRIHKFRGRTDDMLIIRGVNVFPSQIEAALIGIEGVAPHYMLVVDRVNNLDQLTVQVELAPLLLSDEVRKMEELIARVTGAIQSIIQVGVKVQLMQAGSIQRSEGKSSRVTDKRKLYD